MIINIGFKNWGAKKQGHCYSERETAAWPLLFLNNNDPDFYTLLFSGPCFWLDFLKFTNPKNMSSRPDKLKKWAQINWTIGLKIKQPTLNRFFFSLGRAGLKPGHLSHLHKKGLCIVCFHYFRSNQNCSFYCSLEVKNGIFTKFIAW